MKTLFPLLGMAGCLFAAEEPKAPVVIPVSELGHKVVLSGKLGIALGVPVVIEGIVIEGRPVGYEYGPNLRVMRIGGKAIQEDIRIHLEPYFLKWGEKSYPEDHPLAPAIVTGGTFQLEGYETGGFVGIPAEAYRRADLELQNVGGYYFRSDFIVYSGKPLSPIVFGPADFEGRTALLEGTARTKDGRAVMEGAGWTVVVNPSLKWPDEVEGKRVQTDGLYAKTPDPAQFSLDKGSWHLVRLEDQVGKQVELRGRAKSSNGNWWFSYRGADLRVEGMEHLPGWTPMNHWAPVVIRGTLKKEKRPAIRPDGTPETDTSEGFVVTDPSWTPIPALLPNEEPADGF